MNGIVLNEWTEIRAQIACGCYARASAYVTSKGMTAEDVLNGYAGSISFGDEKHDQTHAEICRAAAPPLPEAPFWVDSLPESDHFIHPALEES